MSKIRQNLPYDPVKDFEPVVYTHVVPLLLAVHPSVGERNVQELATWIRANPDKAIYASSGAGSSLHHGGRALHEHDQDENAACAVQGQSAGHPAWRSPPRSAPAPSPGLTAAGIEIQGGAPREFADVIQAEIDKWGRIVKEAGIQPE